MDSSGRSLRLLTHHLSSTASQSAVHTVPSSHPGYEDTVPSASTSSSPFLAQSAAAQFYLHGDDDNNNGHDNETGASLIVLRTLEQGYVLEVSCLPCSEGPVHPFSSPFPQRFLFPAPLLNSMAISPEMASNKVYVTVMTATGWLYRLCFPLHGNSIGDPTHDEDWTTEHRIASIASPSSSSAAVELGGRTPTSLHAIEAGMLLVACKDGTLVKLEQSRATDGSGEYQGPFRESLLRSASFLKGFTQFFSRSSPSSPAPVSVSNTSSDTSAPSHVIAMATHLREDASALGFCLSRDRKLRAWDLVTDTCLRTIELPTAAGEYTSHEEIPAFNSEGPLRPLIRTFAAGKEDVYDYALYLLVYIPAPLPSGSFFALYGVEVLQEDVKALVRKGEPSVAASSSGLGALRLVWQKRCHPETRNLRVELRDACVTGTTADSLAMWSLWDVAGRTVLHNVTLNLDDDADDNEVEAWSAIPYDTSSTYAALYGPRFDSLLSSDTGTPESIAKLFLSLIYEAGRYSSASLSWALDTYSATLRTETIISPTAEDIATIVASGIELRSDTKTGALLYPQYLDQIRREWRRFAGLLEEVDTQGRWPVSLVPTHPTSIPGILMRDRLLFAAEQSLVDAAQTFDRYPVDRTYLAASLGAFYASASGSRREGQARRDDLGSASMEAIECATALLEAIAPNAVASLLTQIDALASAPLESDLLEATLDMWDGAVGTGDSLAVSSVRMRLQAVYASRVAVVLPPQAISDDVAWEMSALEPALWALTDLLTDAAGSTAPYEPAQPVQPSTAIGRALTADGTYQSLQARLNLARSLTVLVLFLHATQEDFTRSFERLPLLLGRLISIGHGLSVLVQLSDCPGAVEASADGSGHDDEGTAVVERMKQLRVGRAHGQVPEDSANLLHKIISLDLLPSHHRRRDAHSEVPGQPQSIAASIASAVASLGITDIGERSIGPSASMPSTIGLLAHRLVETGHPSAALQLVEAFPTTAAAQYVVGRALLATGVLHVQAAEAFLDVLPALLSLSPPVTESSTQEASRLLLSTLPSSVSGGGGSKDHLLSGYYRHIADLFEAIGADAQIALFTRLAVENLRKVDPTSDTLSDLYFRQFRSELALQRFSSCYAIVMEMASVEIVLRRDCLRTLVSAMCEADQVSLLLSYNFAGLQTEVERNLSFKARNCDPRALTGPNYYHILYSYHMQRGDFTSAGAVMYQQAHRLADAHHSVAGVRAVESYLKLAVAQARSYLAAINALSLLASKDAWFANAVINKASNGEAGHHGSAPLSNFVPVQHWQPDSKELGIVRADDVRREYHLVLARLELVQLYPELASPTMALSAADAVALFVRNDQYDKAFSTARALGVDESGIFSSLALKCALTAHIETECMSLQKALQATSNIGGAKSGGDAATQKLLADINEVDDATFVDTFKDVLTESDIATIASWSFLQSSPRTSSWTGPTSTLAWRYLKMHLDTSGPDPKYRLVVLHRLLLLTTSEGQRLDVPRWLITWFEENRSDLLIAAYMRGGLGSDALRAALQWLKQSTKHLDGVTDVSTVGSVAAQQQFVPYLLLDGVLQMAGQPGGTKDDDAGALVAELKKEMTQRRMGVLDEKWRGARKWAEEKERRQNAATATTGAAGTMMVEWD
ncbi:hypothetical protein BCV69DRAFT_52215 [Microstroma glucosiphilum]|uniref:Nuclear pore complex protein Nup160 n=1 Tax=Pseudomicrostroma glucosiphilum TaxID=1684307 RepID=A0A316U0P3_9BASI|nr:hypothetical protein BCV69DRAFT_52215 [Pseudomicrostroma glucosiphilum]PWN18877.1 hypothetical protein BCV69DRAFT_52215 [Pseudomicrostroma glucosiphilum]